MLSLTSRSSRIQVAMALLLCSVWPLGTTQFTILRPIVLLVHRLAFLPMIVHVPDVKIGGIITNLLNKFGYDFRLAWYLRCPEMVDGPSDHFAKCHFGSHLLIWPPVFSSNIGG